MTPGKGLFRPLAGINCNICAVPPLLTGASFRPLAGINCNVISRPVYNVVMEFPSPCGDKLQSSRPRPVTTSAFAGFRPLAEYNFTIPHIESKEKNHPQEKHGWSRKDKS